MLADISSTTRWPVINVQSLVNLAQQSALVKTTPTCVAGIAQLHKHLTLFNVLAIKPAIQQHIVN